jgi:riboflavin biosynthesis pyrimidine reductase
MSGADGGSPGLPSRADPRGAQPLRRLLDDAGATSVGESRGGLVDELAQRYDGDLHIGLRPDRPTIVANFVETIDGVVAMTEDGQTGGGEVSGFSPTDRFVMGLLRALSDVVLVGASSIRTSRRAARTPGGVFPDAAAAFADLRSRLGLAPVPTTLVVTSSGDLDPTMPAFQERTAPIVIAGPSERMAELRAGAFGPNVTFEALRGSAATPDELVEIARGLGARVVTTEAGPRLFADLARAGLADELFLTLAPQLAGRDPAHPRLPLVDGEAFWPDSPRWARLTSVRSAGDHLFLRYRFEEQRA